MNCEVPTKKTVAAFKDYDFDNCNVPEKYWGDYPHRNFFNKYFIPIVRSELKKLAKKLEATIKFGYNNFEWYAFFGKNGKYLYVNTSDHRWNDWYNEVHILPADSDNDFRGGWGETCSFDKLEEHIRCKLG